jgi:tetratricopeptide (TPR) repeat protein
MKSSTRLMCWAGALLALLVLSGCGTAESRKARYVQHGQEYFNAGNYDKARVEYRNAAQIDPKDAQVRYLLGQVAEKLGNAREAVGQYQAAINENPKLSLARAALARLLLYGGLPDKALELVEPGLADDPNSSQLLTARGAARQQLGDRDAALKDAQQAVQLAPDDDYAVALLASLERGRGEIDQAITTVQSGLKHLPKSVDLRIILADLYLSKQQPQEAEAQLRQVIALEPKALTYRYRLAKFYVTQKNADAAERTLREVIASAPDSVDAKLQLVEFLASQHGRDRVNAEIDQMLAKAANDDPLRLALGQFLAQTGGADKAEGIFRGVIAHAGKKPDGLSARDRLAVLRLAANDMPGAAALIDEVLKENARDNDALIVRANLELVKGNPSAAVTDLRSVLRDQPNAVPVMRALARAYEQNGETDQAEEILRSAVQVSPKDSESRLQLANILVGAKKLDQAGPLLEQLARESPLDTAAQESLFRVQAAQKNNAEARNTALNIQKAKPAAALGYYLAGLVDEADGKSDEAQGAYDQALQREPTAIEPLTALIRLQVRLKQPEKAMQRLDAVLAATPSNEGARVLEAELQASQGKLPDAIATYQEVVRTAPNWPEGYHGLALTQVASKKNDDAIRTLRDGIEKTAAAAMLLGDLSTLYEGLGRPDDAIALYESVLAKNPSSSYAANNLAMLLVSHKNDSASLARAQKLADQLAAFSFVDLIDTRGWVKFKSGDYHGAETLLQQAVDKSPDSPELRYHLGMAQLRSGEPQVAEQNLETALRSSRPFSGIDEARAALAQLKKAPSAG